MKAILLAALSILAGLPCDLTAAESELVLEGDFSGQLGPLNVVLHVRRSADGTLSGTLDSPDQGATGIPCADLRINGKEFSFRVPMVSGSWTGEISEDRSTLTGTWSQGMSAPLVLKRTG